jgi:surfeit locus 1 family protein
VLGTVALAAAVLIFLRLGFWQLGRLDERRALNSAVAARLAAPPLPDLAGLQDTAGVFYRTVMVTGTYDHERSIILPGRAYRGVPGVYLLTPLRVDGRAEAVLVNRGWIPSPDAASIDIADFEVVGQVEARGLVLPFPDDAQSLARRRPAPARASQAGGFRRVWFVVDQAELRGQFPYELLPAIVQELSAGDQPPAVRYGGGFAAAAGRAGTQAEPGRSRYPVRLDPPPLDEGPHLGYALQWFSFAIIGVTGWIALLLGGRRAQRAAAPQVPDT